MRYSLKDEFDARLKNAFDVIGYPEEERIEALLELMD